MHKTLIVSALFLSACGDLVSNPCQDYVDYVCECHADDPNIDCETVRAANANAGPDQYVDCEIEHTALLEVAAQMGSTCEDDTGA
jgi:hypothetical protein